MGVTRRDVAKHAGVSPALVSYVVNNGPRQVAPQTRLRVEAAIAHLGYRPNAVARALRANRTDSLGLLVPDQANPFFAELANAIEERAYERHLVVLVGNTNGSEAREARYLRTLVDRQVDALLMIIARSRLDLVAATSAGIPVVVLDRLPPTDGVSTVVVDNEQGAASGTRHLIEHGHETVACIAGPVGVSAADERVAGWRSALLAAHRTPGKLIRAPFTRSAGYEAATALLQQPKPPRALFVSADVQAIGALAAASAAGVRVPDDLAVVSFDGTQESLYTTPALTVVAQPIAAIADAAMARLTGAAEHRAAAGSPHEVLATSLVVRSSCGC